MREKADSELVRRQNRQLVLQALRNAGPLARIELGRATGLSPASITSISWQLIEEGLVRELAETGNHEPAKRGRPMVRLDINPEAARLLVVKLSIDSMELALANFRGHVIARAQSAPPGYDEPANRCGGTIVAEIRRLLDGLEQTKAPLLHVVISVQGVADSQAGTLVWSPAFRARNIPICNPVAAALGVPCTISNDANMIAEGLITQSPEQFGGNSVVIFIGYGVGMGLILNGEVYHGATGAAAEFGHMNHLPDGPLCRCGRRGCIEAFAADYGIARAAGAIDDHAANTTTVLPDTMHKLEAAALNEDGPERRAFAQAGEALGYGIARIVALLTPQNVVLAGPGTRAMPLIEAHLRRAFEDGVVEELRRKTVLSIVPIDTDMIIKGSIDTSLQTLDRELLSAARALHEEHVA